LSKVEKVLNDIIRPASQELGIIVGAPLRDSSRDRLHNSALVFQSGSLMGRQDKTLLPNYDVFDESRYFTPAARREPITVKGWRLGIIICEDIWNDKDYWGEARYEADPVQEMAAKGADILININASPYNYGKRRLRADMLSATAKKYSKPVVYINQVGGNDELVFDGSSMVLDAGGRVVWLGKAFEEDFAIVDLHNSAWCEFEVKEDIQCIHDALVLGTRDYIFKTGFSKAVVGLSGGIDSAVTAVLAAEALGKENVLGVTMPSRYSSEGSISDSRRLAETRSLRIP
jgi:NAD+ synthase (glutamine-hydrolysing)